MQMSHYQVMPQLSAEQYAALRSDIEQHGVIVPVVKDQRGRVIDGHNRLAIATELGIDAPVEIREVTDAEGYDMAVALNCARRHLTREQTRELIAAEIVRRPDDSDRAIARRVGCSPSTVGAVRGSKVSNLDALTLTKEEAEALTLKIKEGLRDARERLLFLAYEGLSNNLPASEMVAASSTTYSIPRRPRLGGSILTIPLSRN